MQTRSSQGSVLGKRAHHVDQKAVPSATTSDIATLSQHMLTPEQSPKSKRARISLSSVQGDSNKENVPPFRIDTRNDVVVDTPRAIHTLVISTPPPTPPVLLLPVYTRARGLLRSTSTSVSPIAGREDERQRILEFITSSWCDSTHSSFTALVNSVLLVSINCMALNGLDALWDRLYEEFIVVLDELDHIASSNQTLSSIFSMSQQHPSTLRIIGIANTHTLTSSLAQLSTCEASSALTLHFGAYSSQQLLQVLQSRLSPLYDNLECPEATEQAKKFLPASTLTLLTKKIASQTGDVRALFEVLRGAIDLAVMGSKVPDADANPLTTPPLIVKPDHILAALKAYLPSTGGGRSSSSLALSPTSNETVSKVRSLGLQVRLALLCILLASKRMEATLSLSASTTSTPTKSPVKRAGSVVSQRTVGLDVAQLHAYYSTVLTRADNDIFTPVSRSEFSDLIGMLETIGLVASRSARMSTASPSKTGRRAFSRAASFGGAAKGAAAGQDIKLAETIRADEVLRGLGVTDGSAASDVREEEVRAIWARECGRITRESKTKSASGMGSDKPFDEAFED
ncbi:hypothetical protein F4604DRAFT_1778415 [Suillus subluteus]|nr:hypothetical protein F4604DRAFT_1778415 [Suillus subluteus]